MKYKLKTELEKFCIYLFYTLFLYLKINKIIHIFISNVLLCIYEDFRCSAFKLNITIINVYLNLNSASQHIASNSIASCQYFFIVLWIF